MNQIMEVLIKNIIRRLHEAGIEDPTEVISCTFQKETIKFRLYSQERWDSMNSTKSAAVQLYTKEGWCNRPDSVVTNDGKVYLVKFIK